MRLFVVCIFLLHACSCCHAQFFAADVKMKPGYRQAAGEFMTWLMFEDTVYNYNNDTALLNENVVWGDLMDCCDDLFEEPGRFTKKEEKYVRKQVRKMRYKKWRLQTGLPVRLITADTLKRIFKDGMFNGWTYIREELHNYLTSYSMPVFLRNYTVCILNYETRNGPLTGTSKTNIYKKENGKWVLAETVCHII